MNNVCLVGRLTADPELKHTQSGKSVTRFSIAVDRKYTKEQQADFINIIAWEGTAEFICKYFFKGQRIGITGRIQTGSYKDSNGNQRYTFDVVAYDVEFVERKSQQNSQSDEQGDFSDMPADEDLPF